MLNKKNISSIIMTMILSLSTTVFVFADENTNVKGQDITKYNEEMVSKNLEDLSIEQLIDIRDKAIDKNLEGLRKFGEDSVKERKDSILNFEFGLVAFVNKNYSNLTEKEKLIRQINIVEYENSINDIMDPSGDFFKVTNQSYQINEFVLKNGKNYKEWSYEYVEFLIEHLEDLCNFVDFDAKYVIEMLDPSIKPDLSDNQKKSLNNELIKMYSSNTLSTNIKDEIENWENNLNINEKNSNEPLPRVSPSSYRQQALAYAKKHGYTNGYYGSTNRKNNAPSPYYNFQKDGYGDCANFVSQCLHEAGVTFWTNNNPWYYYSTSNRSPSWAGAREFKIHWMNRIAYQTLTVSNSLSFLRPATPVSILNSSGVATHTLISTDKHSNGYNFSYAAHSDEGARTNLLKKLEGKKISYYKVYWE
ncbi:amidase domain-containing protein [Clostridioides difficile]|uniref:amidase domain-containing protein n=1 Tax=Clostridioides difficile TaxID=1496 RepID=UPI0008A4AFB2|nr:amidase domain-containing protein [Clostridioides difficile]OFU33090.1 hypothetical protein HMPREF3075_06205 [Clostridium sp. HMSC19B11]EGT3847926.1 hypothetical protein [Clostridioides difficile]EGT4053758.1 hypothetical protein [Clostridioides difficile]EGT4699045.1 hypothetical protein [Clostridioides difficile]EGT4917640.1 hypothetical protein [Clostridioides difficile]